MNKLATIAETKEAHGYTLTGLVTDALRKHDGNQVRASEEVQNILLMNVAILKCVISDVIRVCCSNSVGHEIRKNRAAVISRYSRENVISLANIIASTLMEFTLPGGKRLEDATGEELREASERFLSQGRDMVRKGKWLAAIAERVPDGKTVGQSLSVDTIGELFEEAKNGL